MKRIASLVLASVFGGALALGGFFLLNDSFKSESLAKDVNQNPKVFQTNYIPTTTATLDGEAIDFTKAAEETVNAVVHVKNKAVASSNPIEEFFFGRSRGSGQPRTVGAGSGVIISPDGYIITNNHVIARAEDVEITLNNQKTYKAEVIGAHERSDIALLKIDDTDLPFVPFANSDNVRIGEWVLAVGNPFNLTSTVTAGIVSAKGRDINIGNSNTMIESFIQTDAAVNPGNSGGALVNVRGELVGINTAITSQTGSYVGYSFAVPSNIAKKVIEDIMEFGDVQTAYLNIHLSNLNSKEAKKYDLNGITEGVLITRILEGAARKAGIKQGDIIVRINNVKISKFADIQGYLSAKRPGDEISITILRNGYEKEFSVVLKNQFGKESVGKYDFTNYHFGTLKKISKANSSKFRINYGVEIENLKNRRLMEVGINNKDMILKINDTKVHNTEDVEVVLRKNKGKEVILQILTQNENVEYLRMDVLN